MSHNDLVVVVYQQFQALKLLFTLLFGSRFVFSLVSLALSPFILEQNDFLLAASFSVLGFGAGGFRLPPVALL
jgi:hypothetical protein